MSSIVISSVELDSGPGVLFSFHARSWSAWSHMHAEGSHYLRACVSGNAMAAIKGLETSSWKQKPISTVAQLAWLGECRVHVYLGETQRFPQCVYPIALALLKSDFSN